MKLIRITASAMSRYIQACLRAIYIFALLAILSLFSCTSQRMCRKCAEKFPTYIHDSTTVTITDTVIIAPLPSDTAYSTVYVPCKATDTIIATTHNATAKAWIADSTMHVEVSQGGDVAVTTQSQSRDRYRDLYVQNECVPTKLYINILAGFGFVSLIILIGYIIVNAIIRPNR